MFANVWVGRRVEERDVYVPDPFNRDRHLLGELSARQIDDHATLIGLTLVDVEDAALADRRHALGRPLDRLDRNRAARSLAADERFEAGVNKARAAQEHSLLLAVGFSTRLSESERGAAEEEASNLATTIGDRLSDEFASGGTAEERRYLQQFVAENRLAIAQDVALAREQAFRMELRWQREWLSEGQSVVDARVFGPDATIKEIGTGDVSEIVQRRREMEAELREAFQLEGAARIVARSEVHVPHSLDRFVNFIGRKRVEEMKARMAALERWVEAQPDEWVKQRRAELRTPTLGVSLETRQALGVEQTIANTRTRMIASLTTAEVVEAKDPERAATERTNAAHDQEKIDRLLRDLDELDMLGADPDSRLKELGDDAVLAAVYENEFETRRQLAIAQGVERAIVDPPAHVQDLVGPAPEPGSEQHEKWSKVVREVEGDRLARLSAEQAGLDPPALRTAQQEAELRAQINELRSANDDRALLIPTAGREMDVRGVENG